MDKDFYNKSSAASLGWEPEWFDAKHFDEDLVNKVKKWQRTHRITADGLVGPMTYRRIWTERQAEISDYKPSFGPYLNSSESNFIVHNGKFLPIDWGKVVLWDEPGGLSIRPGNYYDNSGEEDRAPSMFVNHWDVCLSAESCASVLNRRGISVHFCLDNDGTIYQLLDTQHGAWHCSKHAGNKKSIGIEISNAYYPKYQDWYVKNGFGERPLQENGWVHGKKKDPFLWFYPEQIEALKALWKSLHLGLGIPLEFPKESDGSFCTTLHKGCEKGTFEGFCNHYNFVKTKIDCAGLDLPKLLEETRGSLFCADKG
jgi:hypothetical protein